VKFDFLVLITKFNNFKIFAGMESDESWCEVGEPKEEDKDLGDYKMKKLPKKFLNTSDEEKVDEGEVEKKGSRKSRKSLSSESESSDSNDEFVVTKDEVQLKVR